MDFNGSGSLTMRYLWGPTGIVARQTSGGTVVVVPGRSPRHGARPDQQLRRDHRSRRFQRVRNGARRDEPDERRSDDGLCGAGARYGHGVESGGVSGGESGTGRWDSQDPLGLSFAASNLYDYVENNPTEYTDSSGLKLSWWSSQFEGLAAASQIQNNFSTYFNTASGSVYNLLKKHFPDAPDEELRRDSYRFADDYIFFTIRFLRKHPGTHPAYVRGMLQDRLGLDPTPNCESWMAFLSREFKRTCLQSHSDSSEATTKGGYTSIIS